MNIQQCKEYMQKYADVKNIKHTKSKLELSPEVNEIEMQKNSASGVYDILFKDPFRDNSIRNL